MLIGAKVQGRQLKFARAARHYRVQKGIHPRSNIGELYWLRAYLSLNFVVATSTIAQQNQKTVKLAQDNTSTNADSAHINIRSRIVTAHTKYNWTIRKRTK